MSTNVGNLTEPRDYSRQESQRLASTGARPGRELIEIEN